MKITELLIFFRHSADNSYVALLLLKLLDCKLLKWCNKMTMKAKVQVEPAIVLQGGQSSMHAKDQLNRYPATQFRIISRQEDAKSPFFTSISPVLEKIKMPRGLKF